MNGILSSPPPFAQKHEDNKEQIQNIITADSPTPGKSDITDMPSSPPGGTAAEARAENGAAVTTEAVVQIEDEVEVDPFEELQKFDWEELQARYHQMIKERGDAEDKLWDEFKELIDV
jgi:hypothetical protein